MLEARRSRSYARVDVAFVCLSGEEPLRRWCGIAERGWGCSGGEICEVLSDAIGLFGFDR